MHKKSSHRSTFQSILYAKIYFVSFSDSMKKASPVCVRPHTPSATGGKRTKDLLPYLPVEKRRIKLLIR